MCSSIAIMSTMDTKGAMMAVVVGWAVPTVYRLECPIFWWAEPTLQNFLNVPSIFNTPYGTVRWARLIPYRDQFITRARVPPANERFSSAINIPLQQFTVID